MWRVLKDNIMKALNKFEDGILQFKDELLQLGMVQTYLEETTVSNFFNECHAWKMTPKKSLKRHTNLIG